MNYLDKIQQKKRGDSMFENGLQYVRSDFHLHTNKDKEFKYTGEQNSFINDYVSALKEANISVGVISMNIRPFVKLQKSKTYSFYQE